MGYIDGCVTKLNSSGVLQWFTFLGGSDYDEVMGVAVDTVGNVFVVGESRTTWGSPVYAYSGGDEVFVAELDVNGNLVWNTFMGSTGYDRAYSIVINGLDQVYVAGESWGAWGTPVRAYSGGLSDGFVEKLDGSTGNRLWNTFLGGAGQDWANAVALDNANGYVDVVGGSRGTWGSPLAAFISTDSSFIAQLDAGTGALRWNTFFGSGSDSGYGETVDSSGNIYPIGYSGATWGSPKRPFNATSGGDVYVAKFNSSGARQWNTFLGGPGGNFSGGVVLDSTGNLYVDGWSVGTWGTPLVAGDEGWLAKLNAATGSLTYNTFFTSYASNTDAQATSLAIDPYDTVYVGGDAYSSFGSPVQGYSGGTDMAAIKVNPNGSTIWNTFFGASDDDFATAVAYDQNGDIFVTGNSNRSWASSPVNAYAGGEDGFLVKLFPNGNREWVTYFGGTGDDYATAVAVDSYGDPAVAGYSYASWGSPVRAFTNGGGNSDGFVVSFNAVGVPYWNTFLGGSGNDAANGLAFDANGSLYVTGSSNAAWGPAPVRAYQGGYDAYATKLDTNGNIVWNTFLGSSASDLGNAIVTTGSSVYVAGDSYAAWGSPFRDYSSGEDGFVAQLAEGTGSMVMNTFLGGTGDDAVNAITADSNGVIYVAGTSNASWSFPVRAFSGSADAFVARLNVLGGAAMVTFLGGSGIDVATGITVDQKSNIYVTGYSTASWGAPEVPFTGALDGFVSQLGANGALKSNLFTGGTNLSVAAGIAGNGHGQVAVAGYSNSDFYLNNAFGSSYTGGYDGFVTQLSYNTNYLPMLRH